MISSWLPALCFQDSFAETLPFTLIKGVTCHNVELVIILEWRRNSRNCSRNVFLFSLSLLPISVSKLRVYFNPISFFNYGTAERVIPVVWNDSCFVSLERMRETGMERTLTCLKWNSYWDLLGETGMGTVMCSGLFFFKGFYN